MIKVPKTADVDTTTLIIDFKNSDFKKLFSQIQICEYELPPRMAPKPRDSRMHAQNQIWARQQTDKPYYLFSPLNDIPRLYIAYNINEKAPSIFVEKEELRKNVISNFVNERNYHRLIKVLMSCYVHQETEFVSNNIFYLLAKEPKTSKSGNTYASVICIDPSLKREKDNNLHNTGLHELFLADRATRLRQTEYGNRDKTKIPFDLVETDDGQIGFKQLKVFSELEDSSSIFEENTDNSFRTKIKHHSIKSIEDFEQSRNTLLDKFSKGVVNYFQSLGLKVAPKKLYLKQVAKKLSTNNIQFDNFKVIVFDKRFNQTVDITTVIKNMNKMGYGEIFELGKPSETATSKSILILMDYSTGDCKIEGVLNEYNGKDGYRTIKDAGFKISQGFCVNINHFDDHNIKIQKTKDEFLTYEIFNKNDESKFDSSDITRGFQISLEQLYLKSAISSYSTQGKLSIPKSSVLNDCAFIHCFTRYRNKIKKRYQYICHIQNGEISIHDINSQEAEHIIKLYGYDDMFDLLENRKRYNPYAKHNKGDIYLMLNKAFTIEIKDLSERVLYSDKVGDILKDRYDDKEKKAYKLSPNSIFTIEQTKSYNDYLDDNVEDELSFEDLLKGGKTGKYRMDILKMLNIKGERKLTKALGVDGKRSGGYLSVHQGIWFNEDTMEYFVGSKDGYKYDQNKGFQVRKIVAYKGTFDKDQFFPLLNVDFIKHKNYTVLPFMFNLIKMYAEMNKN